MKREWILYIIILLQSLHAFAQNESDSLPKAFFDYNETIEILNVSTANDLALFSDVKDFKEARAFKTYIGYNVIITTVNNKIIRQTLSFSEFEAIQQRVTNYIIAQNRQLKNNVDPSVMQQKANRLPSRSGFYQNETHEGGRNTLIISSTLYGIYYGTILSALAKNNKNPNDTNFHFAPFFLGVYGSAIGAYLYTRNTDIHYGGAVQYATSSYVGLQHGRILYQTLNPNDATAKSILGAELIGSVTEGIAGYYLARRADLAPGQAVMASSNAYWGLLEGTLLALAFRNTFNLSDLKLLNGVVLATSFYGYYLGYSLTNRYSYTIGDGIIFNNVVFLGYLTALAANSQFGFINNNPRISLASIALAYPFSIALAENLLKDYDFKSQQAFIISLGTIFGGGLGVLLSGRHHSLGNTVTSATLCAIAGFTGTYLYEKKFAQTGLWGYKEKIKMQLYPTLVSNDFNYTNFSSMALGIQFNCRF